MQGREEIQLEPAQRASLRQLHNSYGSTPEMVCGAEKMSGVSASNYCRCKMFTKVFLSFKSATLL